MSIKVTGDCMVFSKEHEGRTYYSMGVSTKNQDDTYTKGYMDIQFKKGVVVPNQTKIDIKDAWFKVYATKDGKKKVYLFVNQFESDAVPTGFVQVDDDSFTPF